MKKILYVLFTFFFSYFSNAQVEITPGNSFAKCPNEEIIYTASISSASDESGCQFEWTVTNGVFSNNTTTFYGNPVTVKWSNTTALGKLSVEVYTCDLSSVDGLYSTNVWIKSIANETPESIVGPSAIPVGALNAISYKIPRMYYPNTGDEGQPNLQEVDGYEWIIPSGWKLGGITSDGVTFFTNQEEQVSVTPDNCSGDGFKLKVRGFSSCGSGYYSNWREISINRPLPTLSFTQSPPDYVVCQDTNPITVSVSPITGATSYTWTKPDGWSGNSTSNSIVLVPDGFSEGTVSVKANVCGRETSILSKNISFEIVSPSNPPIITGTSMLCTSNRTFSIQNLPPNSTVNWSKGGHIAYVSGQGTSNYTVKASSSTVRGDGWIQATITSPCGSITLPRKNIWVGPPDQAHKYDLFVQGFSGQSSITLASEGLYTFQINPVRGANSYTWDFPPGFSFLEGFGQNSYVAKIWTPAQGGNYTIRVYPTGSCGSSGTGSQSLKIYIPGGSPGGPIGDPNCPEPPCRVPDPAVVYPNPATNQVSISFSDSIFQNNLKNGYQITVFNQHQKEVLNAFSTKQAWEMNTSSYPKGIYIININYKEGVLRKRLVIE